MQQRALMRHHLATAARLSLLLPAQESPPVTYCPRPPHGLRWEALRNEKAVVPRERRWLVEEWNGRAARAARGSRRRVTGDKPKVGSHSFSAHRAEAIAAMHKEQEEAIDESSLEEVYRQMEQMWANTTDPLTDAPTDSQSA